MTMESNLIISPSPQIHAKISTRSMMAWVLIALAPAGIWGIALFGIRAAVVLLTAAASAVLTEFLLNLAAGKKQTINDLSAVLTGVLVAFNMPSGIPLYIPVIASVFGIGVVKWCFGGLGSNWMNPALAGRVFAFFSWGSAMSTWPLPRFGGMAAADALTGPTPLGAVKTAFTSMPKGIKDPMAILESTGNALSYVDMFLGRMPGSLGEISAMLLLLGGIVLIVQRIVDWEIPVAYIAVFSFLIWAFDGLHYGTGMFSGNVLFHLLSGGLILGAFFMATDLTTSPITVRGRIIFGLGCGFFTFLLRNWGSLPEGVSLAIIFMNILTPLIDKHIRPKRYGISR